MDYLLLARLAFNLFSAAILITAGILIWSRYSNGFGRLFAITLFGMSLFGVIMSVALYFHLNDIIPRSVTPVIFFVANIVHVLPAILTSLYIIIKK
jgi:hypothetical protein